MTVTINQFSTFALVLEMNPKSLQKKVLDISRQLVPKHSAPFAKRAL